MPFFSRLSASLAFWTLFCLPFTSDAQTLSIQDDVQRFSTLSNTTATLSGKSELHLTGSGDPTPGCTIHLNSEEAWVFFHNVKPSSASTTQLPRIRVSGAVAVLDSNVRVVEHVNGCVVIPHPADYRPLRVFARSHFTGSAADLSRYTAYGSAQLGPFSDNIRSFILKRGYTATFAQNENGTGTSRNYVAQDADLEVAVLPSELDGAISFIRVFPWRWTGKKGSCDVDPVALKANWHYNWNISLNSALDWEYVAIKQQPYWPGLGQDWRARAINHLSGFNEPDNPVEDAYKNLNPPGSVTDAVARWPELLGTGLRVGAPAVTDGGTNWIASFISQAEAAGMRVDYVPVHYYRSYWNKNDPAGAANQLYNFLKSIHDVAQRPIWVTEFNNGANWTDNAHDPDVTQNRNAIEAMIQMMDDTPWIERYAVYSRVEWFRQTHYDDGSITPMGIMYRDHVAPMAHQQVVPDSGRTPSADYLFDTDTRDGSGNGNNPLVYGTPKLLAGKHGKALSFDGTDDYLALPARLGDSTDFTFTAWVKWNGGNPWQRIFDLGNGTAHNLLLTPRSGSNTLRFQITSDSVGQTLNAPQLPTGTWTHVAVTLSGNTGKLFVNGSLVDTQSITFNPVDIGTQTNYLGKSQWPDPLFSGSLDSVRFLNTALSDAQIAAAASPATLQFSGDLILLASATPNQPYTASLATYATNHNGGRIFSKVAGTAWLAVAADGTLTGVPTSVDTGNHSFLVRVIDSTGLVDTAALEILVAEPAGMVARFPFDGNAAAAVGNLQGTTTGTPTYIAGRHTSAIAMDGVDDFVTLPFGVANHDEITIATWVWWDGGNIWQRIFDFGNGTGENLFLTPRSGGNSLRFSATKDGVSQELNAAQLPINTWTHVAVTLGAGTGKLYVNGALTATQAISLKPSDIMPATNFLGKSQWPDPLFDGRLDEFVIFNRALDAAKIAALYSGAPPTFSTDPFSKPDGAVGANYVDSITATGNGLTFSKAGGPKWLTVEPDGRISGVPSHAEVGTNRFAVRVTNASGIADDATMNLVVAAPNDLRAHYQFQGTPADSAHPTGPTFHGTATGGPSYSAGIFGQAMEFDGVDDYVTLPSGFINALNDITIAMRLRWDGGSDWQRIFDFGNGTGSYMFLSPSSGSKTLRFAMTTGSGEQRLNTSSPAIGESTHIVITLIGNTGTLYVNGAPVDTQTITLNPSTIAPANNFLGKSQFAADPLFNGAIDDFRIYNRGLSAQEVSSMVAPPVPIVVPTPYQSWVATIAFPAGESSPELDPDGDSLANVFEFLLGKNPLVPDGGALPAAQVRTAAEVGRPGSKHYLTVSARVRINRESITVLADGAPSPSGLNLPSAAAHAISLGAPIPNGEFEILTWYYDVAIEDAPGGYMRVRARVE